MHGQAAAELCGPSTFQNWLSAMDVVQWLRFGHKVSDLGTCVSSQWRVACCSVLVLFNVQPHTVRPCRSVMFMFSLRPCHSVFHSRTLSLTHLSHRVELHPPPAFYRKWIHTCDLQVTSLSCCTRRLQQSCCRWATAQRCSMCKQLLHWCCVRLGCCHM